MRFAHLSVFALSGLSIASPVVTKRSNAISLLTDLYATVQIHTSAINVTLAVLSPSSSSIEKTAATAEVGKQFNLLAVALTVTTNNIKALPYSTSSESTKSIIDAEIDVLGVLGIDIEIGSAQGDDRQFIAVGALLSCIIVEILATVSVSITILGRAGLLFCLNPLSSALSILVLNLKVALDIGLVDVIALLNSLLKGLALGAWVVV
ncbi:hypothetical protein EJ02DRAFT_382926 [Clathrospora elynae]|uniref:Uncharacterized protein n=1 Tax=Clathrospora elynae TaxID=706981 RepID=A0A6A5SGE5_9PLEO|nr:hypothetical protein EJ02DRAFT_382926 [Clathrospora elynae]